MRSRQYNIEITDDVPVERFLKRLTVAMSCYNAMMTSGNEKIQYDSDSL